MTNRKITRIPCPICGKSFDARGHHNHVEKCIRLSNSRSQKKAKVKRNTHSNH